MKLFHLLIVLGAVLSETYSLSSLKEIMGRQGGSVWIPCYYDVKYRNTEKYFFQKSLFGFRTILTQTEQILTAGVGERITISDDKSQGIFTITMKSLEKRDEGYYYCGLKRAEQFEEVYLYLSVDAGDYGLSINSNSNVFTGPEGGTVAVSCKYKYTKYVSFIKYWCRGRDFASCQKLKSSDSHSLSNNRVWIRDDSASQKFTVTMTSLQRTDSDWYWCAIKRGSSHERVPVYIRVTQAPEPEQLQKDTSSSLQSTMANAMTVTASGNQSVYVTINRNSTDHRSETPGTHRIGGDSRAHWTIALVIGGLLLLSLTAGIFTLRMMRIWRGGIQNKKRATQPHAEGRSELVTEPPSEDMQYSVISFQRKTKEDPKPPRDPEDNVTYSVIGYKRTTDMYIYEN